MNFPFVRALAPVSKLLRGNSPKTIQLESVHTYEARIALSSFVAIGYQFDMRVLALIRYKTRSVRSLIVQLRNVQSSAG